MCGLHTLMVFISSRIHGMFDRPCLRVSLVSDEYIYIPCMTLLQKINVARFVMQARECDQHCEPSGNGGGHWCQYHAICAMYRKCRHAPE